MTEDQTRAVPLVQTTPARGSLAQLLNRYRRWFVSSAGIGSSYGPKGKLIAAVLIFFVSLMAKSLHSADLAPIMHTIAQEQSGMASEYYREALRMLQGHGVLIPDNVDGSDETLLVHGPGYSLFQAAVFSVFGGSYFTLQLLQNLLNTISPILLFLIADRVFGSRVGVVSGLLAAISHHFSYYSNVILPDSLCALPLLGAIYLLVATRRSTRWEVFGYATAGALIAASIWLRPNSLLLGPFIALALFLASHQKRRTARRAWIIAVVPFLFVAPITLRNWIIYRQFVLVSCNTGIVLWEGIGDESGDRFGAVNDDVKVAKQEAGWYDTPAYAEAWWHPDGIKRDRDRIRRSVGVIARNPIWFSGAMLRRMSTMLKYSAGAPLILKRGDEIFRTAGEAASREKNHNVQPDLDAIEKDRWIPNAADKLSFARWPLRALQRVTKECAQLFIAIGLLLVLAASWRRWLLTSLVPLYYLLIQSMMHTEFRYTLPIHYFLFVFAAVTWVTVFNTVCMRIKGLVGAKRDAVS